MPDTQSPIPEVSMLRRHSVSIRLFAPLLAFGLLLSPTASADDNLVPDDASSWGSAVIEEPSGDTANSAFRSVTGSHTRYVDGGT